MPVEPIKNHDELVSFMINRQNATQVTPCTKLATLRVYKVCDLSSETTETE